MLVLTLGAWNEVYAHWNAVNTQVGMPPQVPQSINSQVRPIHFEDFSGRDFERLVFAYAIRQGWANVEWIGQVGSDGGRDITCQGRSGLMLLMCANYRDLTRSKAKSDLHKAADLKPKPDEVFVIAGGSVSSGLRANIKSDAGLLGFAKCHIWSGPELEERIRLRAEDLLMRFCDGVAFPESAAQIKALAEAGNFQVPDTHRKNPFFVCGTVIETALRTIVRGDVVVLHGLAGVGKTQCAVQYAHTYRENFGRVFWVSAASLPTLREAFAALTELPRLGLSIAPGAAPHEKRRAMNAWLKSHSDWLLIFDNADDAAVAREIEGIIPASHAGCVLVTSQYKEWTSAFRHQVIGVWNETESVAFLQKRLSTSVPSYAELSLLAVTLGGLPLALEQAAAYITRTRISPSRYVDLFRRNTTAMLSRHVPGMTDYRSSVINAWFLSIRRLSFGARYILHLCSCLAPLPVPRQIFTFILASARRDFTHGYFEINAIRRALPNDESVNAALGELASYSLVSLSERTLTCHSLLQATIRNNVTLRWWHYSYRVRRYLDGLHDKTVWASALWPKRVISLLNTDGVLPWRGSGPVPEMRDFAPHIESALACSLPEVPDRGSLSRGQLESTLQSFRRQEAEHTKGMATLETILNETARHAPQLQAETTWFLSSFEQFYEGATTKDSGDQLPYKLASLLRERSPGPNGNPYGLIRDLARAQFEAGAIESARRLFRFAFEHARADGMAFPDDAGCARIEEAILLKEHTTREEQLRLLREGLAIMAPKNADNHYFINGCASYGWLATTDDDIAQALQWAELANEPARALLPLGYHAACYLAVVQAQLLHRIGRAGDALLMVDATLAPALRAPKVKRQHLVLLWEMRAIILVDTGEHLRAARSFARCLFLERKFREPTASRQSDLLRRAASAFARGGNETAAKRFNSEAAGISS